MSQPILWLMGCGRVYRSPEGQPLRMLGVNYDITERKQAEAARQESERRLAAELDAITRLMAVGALFVHETNLQPVLDKIVETAIAISFWLSKRPTSSSERRSK